MAKSFEALPFFMPYIQPMQIALPAKSLLVQKLLSTIEERKAGLDTALAAAKESRDNDTKSSAGDKFETGRAMMQQEMDKLEQQRHHLMQHYHQLLQMEVTNPHQFVGLASLVQTDKGFYFLAIPYGKILLEELDIFVISTAAPFAQAILGKKAGDSFSFQQQQGRILQLI